MKCTESCGGAGSGTGNNSCQGILYTLNAVNIARRNAAKNRACIIQSGTNNSTGDGI